MTAQPFQTSARIRIRRPVLQAVGYALLDEELYPETAA